MKKEIKTREISRAHLYNLDGYAIKAPDGALDRFYPAKVNHPTEAGSAATVEVSEELFTYVSVLQNAGFRVVFNI